jgi:malate synthase
VLIETILGALEVEEILYSLRKHICACNAGRWDYIFSAIKKFKNFKDMILPDRLEVGMTVPFMRAYTERLVHVCHKRGAHAIGGMAPFIPSKSDAKFNEFAKKRTVEDKTREVGDGFDGSWVAHPDIVDVARAVFSKAFGTSKVHQKENLRKDVKVTAEQITNLKFDSNHLFLYLLLHLLFIINDSIIKNE